jgi:hypothetical protein
MRASHLRIRRKCCAQQGMLHLDPSVYISVFLFASLGLLCAYFPFSVVRSGQSSDTSYDLFLDPVTRIMLWTPVKLTTNLNFHVFGRVRAVRQSLSQSGLITPSLWCQLSDITHYGTGNPIARCYGDKGICFVSNDRFSGFPILADNARDSWMTSITHGTKSLVIDTNNHP